MRSQGALVWMFWGWEKDKAIVTIIIMDNIIIIINIININNINNMIIRGKGPVVRMLWSWEKDKAIVTCLLYTSPSPRD